MWACAMTMPTPHNAEHKAEEAGGRARAFAAFAAKKSAATEAACSCQEARAFWSDTAFSLEYRRRASRSCSSPSRCSSCSLSPSHMLCIREQATDT
jgi:hypothetical protein